MTTTTGRSVIGGSCDHEVDSCPLLLEQLRQHDVTNLDTTTLVGAVTTAIATADSYDHYPRYDDDWDNSNG